MEYIAVEFKFNEIESHIIITTDIYRLSKREINELSSALWNYSWKVEGVFEATNIKGVAQWTFKLYRDIAAHEIRRELRDVLLGTVKVGKSIRYRGFNL